MSKRISVTVQEPYRTMLVKAAKKRRESEASVVREALREYFDHRWRKA